MADIELVIKIDEKIIQQAKHYHDLPYDDYVIRVAEAIANGTPLPKGHGRIGDLSKIYVKLNKAQIEGSEEYKGLGEAKQIVSDAPTIIEADKEGEE